MERGNAIVEAGKIEACCPATRDSQGKSARWRRIRAFFCVSTAMPWSADHSVPHGTEFVSSCSIWKYRKFLTADELKACARDPGLRAKIAVKSNDRRRPDRYLCRSARFARHRRP